MKLQLVGLRGAARLRTVELSGGMARRVTFARAIVMDPPLLFCDEPFNGLDPIAVGVVLRLLQRMKDALGMTIVLVSHEVREILRIADVGSFSQTAKSPMAAPPTHCSRVNPPLRVNSCRAT
jgi:phospholipid/cholesterol/gamma-HCH transport system ATP-binding protein